MRATDRIGHQLKLRDLHIFMTVVSAGSMGKAAERLNTVQPAVSRSIAELEKTLGVRLLDRNRQGVEPTEYGRSLLQCGVAVFDDLRQGVKNIEFLSDPTVGEVRVGSSPFLSASFVAAVIDRVSRRYPGIACRLVSARAETLKRDLGERSVELVIAPMLDSFDAERLEFEPLYEDTFVVVAGAQNPLARRRNVKFRDLMDEPWVLPPSETAPGSLVMQAFHASSVDFLRKTVCTAPFEARMSLLETGRFLSIFASSALVFPIKRKQFKVLPIELPIARVLNGIITLKNRTLSPVAQLFLMAARDIAKSNPK